MKASALSIACFGEILWDLLPQGRFPGGAPCNVAYHLHQQGAGVTLVSATGDDALGDALRQRLAAWGVSTHAIARLPGRTTGTVQATLNARGEANYHIATNVAWDEIPLPPLDVAPADRMDALVFGSLALRSPANEHTLDRLLARLPIAAWRVFDVNLRPPFDDLERVERRARQATLLKLNTVEATRLTESDHGRPGAPPEEQCRALAARFGCAAVCLTRGAQGAGLLKDGNWSWEAGKRVPVCDTVGCGDAFLATLLVQLLRGENPAAALGKACRVGEWLASQPGGTPEYLPSGIPRS